MRKVFLLLLPFILILGACTHGNCRAQKKGDEAVTSAPNAGSSATAVQEDVVAPSTERVKVFKPDGSLQCGQGKAIPLADMQKQLKNIKVYSAVNKNDGMMRIQVCGSPTGNSNVYEIHRKDLEAAIKAGFKEWTFE